MTHRHLQFHRTLETAGLKAPVALLILQRSHHLQADYGFRSPCTVPHHVAAHAVHIAGLTIVRLVQFHTIDTELHIPAVILLIEGKHRTVARLDAPVGMTAIQGTGISVLTVHTHKGASLRTILLVRTSHLARPQ